jgi:hypothetical protein
LCTKSALRKPEHETQLRPLLGLPPEQALAAWTRAVAIAGGRKVRVRLVKAAVQELHLAHDPPGPKLEPRQPKAQKQRLIDSGFGELLVLLSQKAAHETLTTKLEALHGQVRALFAAPGGKPAKPVVTSAWTTISKHRLVRQTGIENVRQKKTQAEDHQRHFRLLVRVCPTKYNVANSRDLTSKGRRVLPSRRTARASQTMENNQTVTSFLN